MRCRTTVHILCWFGVGMVSRELIRKMNLIIMQSQSCTFIRFMFYVLYDTFSLNFAQTSTTSEEKLVGRTVSFFFRRWKMSLHLEVLCCGMLRSIKTTRWTMGDITATTFLISWKGKQHHRKLQYLHRRLQQQQFPRQRERFHQWWLREKQQAKLQQEKVRKFVIDLPERKEETKILSQVIWMRVLEVCCFEQLTRGNFL